MEIKILKNILESNENCAGKIRAVLDEKKIKMFNFISSPGSGKTSLLEKTLECLAEKYRFAIIEGDITTDKDAVRLSSYPSQLVLINTGGGCHLNSNSILRAFNELDLDRLDFILIENVGNLVCPAEFNLGEHAKIAMLSTPEGDDKPAKYPMLFREAELIILNKTDLSAYVNFDKKTFYKELRQINPGSPVIEMSVSQNTGMDKWYKWLESKNSN